MNEAPTFTDDTATRTIAENSAAGTNIGAVITATDPDTNNTNFNTLTYSLTGTDASKFNIGSSTGQITVKTGNIPDYEAKTSYSVTVGVSDGKKADGTADTSVDDTIAVTINVTDVNEPPPKPGGPTLVQNSTNPNSQLDVSWTAPNMSGKPALSGYDVQYKETGSNSYPGSRSVGASTTSLSMTGLSGNTSYDVRVRAKNAEGESEWAFKSASTKADNSPPTFDDGATATRSVDENSTAGTLVGAKVAATDADGDALTYTLSGADASKFDIGSSTGQITPKSGTTLDYETKTSYSVTVSVTDNKNFAGGTDNTIDDTISVTINVADVSEPPPKPDTPTVTQNTATPKTQLDVSWTALTNTQMEASPRSTTTMFSTRKNRKIPGLLTPSPERTPKPR